MEIRQIESLYPTEEEIAVFIDRCNKKALEEGIASLRESERIVYLANTFDFEVVLRGLTGFYNNSAGDHAEATIVALTQIGALQAAQSVNDSVKLFPDVCDRESRQDHIPSLFGQLRECESYYDAQTPDICALLHLYIRRSKLIDLYPAEKNTSPVAIEFRDSDFVWSNETGIFSILREDARKLARAIRYSLASYRPLQMDVAGEKLFFTTAGKGNYGEFARTERGIEFQTNRVDLQKIAEELHWLADKVPTPNEFVHFHLEPTLMSGNDIVDDFVFELKE